jgi:hypothetical protein
MTTKQLPYLLTGIIISGTVFLSHVSLSHADDSALRNIYNNPSIQTQLQINDQDVQWNNRDQAIRTQFRQLMREHTIIGGITFLARYENSSYLPQLQQQMRQNTEQLTDMIGKLYGQNQQNNFQNLWNNHMDLLNQYTDAKKNNDSLLINQTNQQLQTNIDKLADFFAQKDPSQKSAVSQMIQTNTTDEQTIIDTHATGHDNDLLNLFFQAINHADTLSEKITQLSPHFH